MTDFAAILPPTGSLVRLIEAPRGSWARAGEVVRVRYAKHQKRGVKGIFADTSVQVWDEARDCGTIDKAMFWRWAKWELINE